MQDLGHSFFSWFVTWSRVHIFLFQYDYFRLFCGEVLRDVSVYCVMIRLVCNYHYFSISTFCNIELNGYVTCLQLISFMDNQAPNQSSQSTKYPTFSESCWYPCWILWVMKSSWECGCHILGALFAALLTGVCPVPCCPNWRKIWDWENPLLCCQGKSEGLHTALIVLFPTSLSLSKQISRGQLSRCGDWCWLLRS